MQAVAQHTQERAAADAEEAGHAAHHAAEHMSSPEAVPDKLCLAHLRWLLLAAPADVLAVLKVCWCHWAAASHRALQEPAM